MTAESGPPLSPQSRPKLPRGVRLMKSEAHGGWVLLAPERVFKADDIAAEILGQCNGTRSIADIVDDLARRFAAPRDEIAGDVTALLSDLRARCLLELE